MKVELPAPLHLPQSLQALLDHVPIGMAIFDLQWRYLYINSTLAESNGLAAEQHLGRSVKEILPDVADTIESLLAKVVATASPIIDYPVSGIAGGAQKRKRQWLASYYPSFDDERVVVGVSAVVRDVTEQHDALLQARQSEGRLQQVLDSLFVFVGMLTPDGTLVEANRAPLEAAGISIEDVRGLKFWDCFWWNHDAGVQQQLMESVRRVAAGEIVRYDVTVRMKNDSRMTIDFMMAPLFDASGAVINLIPSAIDVTTRVENQIALRESEELFRKAVEVSPNGMALVSEDGHFRAVNTRMAEMFRYELDELNGLTIENLIPSEYRHRHESLFKGFFRESASRDMAGRRPLFALRKDGSKFPVEVGLNPIPNISKPLVLATIMDISSRRLAEQAVERNLMEKTALLGEVHHRVKNNLQVISSLLSLQASRAPKELRPLFNESQVRVRAMALIHQLLYERNDFSQVEMGEYLSKLVALLGELMLRGRSDIKLTVQSHLPVMLNLRQAVPCGLLVNELITNAIKHAFLPGCGGDITVELTADENGSRTICISDTGMGLPESVKLGETESLGFQLIPLLAEQAGGTLEIHRGNGTRFLISINQGHES